MCEIIFSCPPSPPPPLLLYQFFKECLNFPVLFFLNLERLFTPRIRKECNNIISEKSLPALPSPSSSLASGLYSAALAVTQVLSSPAVPRPASAAGESCNCVSAVIWRRLRFGGFWRNLPKAGDFRADKMKYWKRRGDFHCRS